MEIVTATKSHDNLFIKNKLNFIEVVRPERIVALTKLKDYVEKDQRNDFWNDTCNNLSEIYGKAVSELSMIGDIINNMTYDEEMNRWTIKTKYFSKGNTGRVYAEYGSLGTMRRVFRHFVSEGIYYDIDIKNCHPTLLYNICKAWSIPCDNLELFVTDRDKVIRKIMKSGFTKIQAKRLISALINGSTVEGYMKKNEIKMKKVVFKREDGKKIKKEVKLTKFVNEFIKEMKNIHKFIINHDDKTKELYKEITDGKKFNKEGKFISMFLQMNEMMILEFALDFTVDYGITDRVGFEGVSIHDGFQLLQSAFHNGEKDLNVYLHYLNEAVKEAFGFDIEFINKPFDEAHIVREQLEKVGYIVPDHYNCPFYEKYGVYKRTKYNTDDEFIASLFIHGNSEDYVTSDGKVYYLDNNGLYKCISNEYFNKKFSEYMTDFVDYCEKMTSETFSIGSSIGQYLQDKNSVMNVLQKADIIPDESQQKTIFKNLCLSKSERTKFFKLLQTADNNKNDTKKTVFNKIRNKSSRQSIVDDIKQKLVDDEFAEKLDKDPYLLGFNNGLLDLRTFEFRKAKKGEYVNMSCGYDWFYGDIPEEVMEASKFMYGIISDMFHNVNDCDEVLKILSRCLKGEGNLDEIALFFKGTGGNGKSLLMKIMAVVMGEYFQPLTYNVFINESKDNRSQDLADCYLKRFIEVQEPSAEFTFKSDIFKRYTGGDEVTTKGNYHKGKSLRFIFGCLHFCSNHYITFDKETKEDCLKRRIVGCFLPKKFFKKDDPEYDPKNPNHRIRDETLKKRLDNEVLLKQGMMVLMLKYYKLYLEHGIKITDNMKKATDEYFSNMSDGATLFNTMIEKTGNSSDKIILSDKAGYGLRELFLAENNTENFSTTKFNKFIKKEFGDSSVGVGMLGYNADEWKKVIVDKQKKVSKSKGRVLIGYRYKEEYLKKYFDDDSEEEKDYGLDM